MTKMVTFWILQILLGIRAILWSTRVSHQKKMTKRMAPMTRQTIGCARALESGQRFSGVVSDGATEKKGIKVTHHPSLSPPSVSPKMAKTAAATMKNVPT